MSDKIIVFAYSVVRRTRPTVFVSDTENWPPPANADEASSKDIADPAGPFAFTSRLTFYYLRLAPTDVIWTMLA